MGHPAFLERPYFMAVSGLPFALGRAFFRFFGAFAPEGS